MERFLQLLLATATFLLVSCTASSAFSLHSRRLHSLGALVDEVVGEIAPRDGNLTSERSEIEDELVKFGDVLYFEDRESFEASSLPNVFEVSSTLDSKCPVIFSQNNRTLVKELSNNCNDDAEIEFSTNEGAWRSYVLFLADDGDDDDDDNLLTMDTYRELCADDCCEEEYNLDQGGKYCYHVLVNEDRDFDEECADVEEFVFECDDE